VASACLDANSNHLTSLLTCPNELAVARAGQVKRQASQSALAAHHRTTSKVTATIASRPSSHGVRTRTGGSVDCGSVRASGVDLADSLKHFDHTPEHLGLVSRRPARVSPLAHIGLIEHQTTCATEVGLLH
jgi:hypothetical protein